MSLIYSSAKKDFLYWNVLIFIMELPNDVKVQFYELRKKVQSFNQLLKRFGMDVSG
ncbi:IS861, transposase OrfA [Streptococcus pneumoniae]|nr:IS861, transposase OrfA [Streptococcus pneumoniae]VJF69133.1 IS861, transposase OrfA [Streptococcus pneumoniae]VLZ88101.1 IS861, transposase OrfA [Streptococcus pneumoniae]VPH78424.1 IS861, transposase OrfA [Streptococcus pneumoniae]VSA67844.1 IS861, transposase OrfA [Streptococcus pneumoniae]